MKMNTAQKKKMQMEQAKAIGKVNGRIREAFLEGQRSGIYDTVYMMLWVLHEKEGYGKQRLTRVYKELVKLADCVIEEEKTALTLDDIKKALAEECGIVISPVK